MSTTPKLDHVIEFHKGLIPSSNQKSWELWEEIREHLQRIPVPQATRYPSEIETRLIELVERLLHRFKLPSQDFASIDLAAIKRDLGLS